MSDWELAPDDGWEEVKDKPQIAGFGPIVDYAKGVGKNAVGAVENWAHAFSANPLKNAFGTGEAALNMGTSMLSAPLALAAQMSGNTRPAKDIRADLTYQPRSEMGKAIPAVAAAPMKPVGDAFAGISRDISKVAPLDEDQVQAGLDTAAMFTPFISKGAAPGAAKPPIPTTGELSAAASKTYKRAEEAGVVISPQAYTDIVTNIRAAADRAKVNPNLHPKASAALDVLDESVGKPVTLEEADQLRQVVKGAIADGKRGDRRIAKIIEKKLDDSLDGLTPDDTVAGNVTGTVDVLKQARNLYRRKSNSEMLDRMDRLGDLSGKGRYTQGGEALGTVDQFRALARNEKKMRVFSPEETAAIDNVVTGSGLRRGLRNFGKLDPTKGGMPLTMGLGIGGGTGSLVGGPVGATIGAAIVPPAAFIANRLASRMTKADAAKAREVLVGRDPATVPPPIQPRAPQPPAPLTGELMPRAPLPLPPPSMVQGQRSPPGTAYSRQVMGLTPDVERAGMQHPGVAMEKIQTPLRLPNRPLPKQVTDQSPMVVDSSGRAAASPGLLNQYMDELGMKGMQNVRQPAANPSARGILSPEPEAPVVKPVEVKAVASDAIKTLEAEAKSRKLFTRKNPTQKQLAEERDWTKRYAAAKSSK